jgi:hypothetical protein
MRGIRTTAAAVVMMFGTMQLATAQELTPVRPAGAGLQQGIVATNQSGSISGYARKGGNNAESIRQVQLRDAQSGRVVATGATDKAGAFSFNGIQPGTYIVEVLGGDQSVLAASSILTLHAGEALSIALTVPLVAAGGLLGSTVATAGMIAAGAAAAGILAVKKVGDPTCPQ